MTARDTRTGGKHEARERGAYETARDKDFDAIVWLERERKKDRGSGWYPFREFFEKLMDDNRSPA